MVYQKLLLKFLLNFIAGLNLAGLLGNSALHGQVPLPHVADPVARIDELENTVQDLSEQITRLQTGGPQLAGYSNPNSCSPGTHYLSYDQGWVVRPRNVSRTPFELQFNFHDQFRHTGFNRSVNSFTDSAGNTFLINNRNDFDINRGRLVFSGFAFDPKLTFYTNIDYNTVAANQVQPLLSWISYRFSECFTLSSGLGKVPGGWEWEETSRYTLGAERTMATTFFRPSITAGIWAQGKIRERLYYRALIGDGFNTFSLRANELDTNFVYSALVWWEPLGAYGVGFSDLERHESLSLRLGQSITFDRSEGDPTGEPGPEQTLIRLSDGTRLVEPGALAPGVTVNQFDILLYSVHGGAKFRGVSLAIEYYFRWLNSIQGTGPLPVDSLFDHGFYVQSGMFVIPERLEPYVYGSQVSGDFGTGTEVGGGCNLYLNGQRGARLTFDVAHLEGSPAQQDRTGLVAGASGTLFRTQLWTFF